MTNDSLIAELVEALKTARQHVAASNGAEHLWDGFGPRTSQPSDTDLEIVDAALSHAQAAPSDGWQPIETAPKDEQVDLWVDGRRLINCRWHFIVCDTGSGMQLTGGGAWWGEYGECIGNPTHWRPLPPPPAKKDPAP